MLSAQAARAELTPGDAIYIPRGAWHHVRTIDDSLSTRAAQIALRTQQVIAYETGAASVIDPLGGSYFVEALTNRMEEAAEEYFQRITEMGKGSMLEGMLVVGALDVIAREPAHGTLVVDYKSDRLEGADPAELVARQYSSQQLI